MGIISAFVLIISVVVVLAFVFARNATKVETVVADLKAEADKLKKDI